jgi:hypothetical protein
MGYLGFLAHQCAVFLRFWAFADGFLNGFGTALLGTDSTVLSARVNRSAASGPSIISGWGFMAPSWHRTAEWMFCEILVNLHQHIGLGNVSKRK